jgi:Rieske Fe-S protein
MTAHVTSSPVPDPEPPSRGRLVSTVMMLAGLAGGYGLFAWIGTRFMMPSRTGRMLQLFVMAVNDVREGETLLYRTPDGHSVNITRRGTAGGADDFVALGSTCPHLGCQVSWEPQNNRYFCPCHNGTFDPSGKATGGPPGDAGLSLPKYTLTVQRGMLFIDVPAERLTLPERAGVVHISGPQGAGHDPCLTCLKRGRADREAIG